MAFDSTASIDVQELLRGEFGTGHEFRNISIKIKISWFDWLLNVFTLGLANSQTIEVTGDPDRAAADPWAAIEWVDSLQTGDRALPVAQRKVLKSWNERCVVEAS